ncbi:UNVERIFIED_CONTAM: hypothetical protein Sradi_1316800 [Sesamum radiatum]|uniref:Uncharacterized protein n=1 Tax=Sesamum radiatum TaxID=300843 RepID=A0AAW2UQ54_SESRA
MEVDACLGQDLFSEKVLRCGALVSGPAGLGGPGTVIYWLEPGMSLVRPAELGHYQLFSRSSLLDAWESSTLIYLAARARRASNLVVGFLARDLKKPPSSNHFAKALALTSWVTDGTSKAAVLKHWRYSFRGSPSFWQMENRLNSFFWCFSLLANWCRKREPNSWKLPITAGVID